MYSYVCTSVNGPSIRGRVYLYFQIFESMSFHYSVIVQVQHSVIIVLPGANSDDATQ